KCLVSQPWCSITIYADPFPRSNSEGRLTDRESMPIAPRFAFSADRAVLEVRLRHFLAVGTVTAGVPPRADSLLFCFPGLQELFGLLQLVLARRRQCLAGAVDEELDHANARADSLRANLLASH